MPLADRFLDILRCPDNRTRLRPADAALVNRLNRAIALGAVANVGGERVKRPIDSSLVREDGERLYPILDDIPVLLPDEAIDLTRL
jgi:uncharacterized protein YbaR (Trm112 family)